MTSRKHGVVLLLVGRVQRLVVVPVVVPNSCAPTSSKAVELIALVNHGRDAEILAFERKSER